MAEPSDPLERYAARVLQGPRPPLAWPGASFNPAAQLLFGCVTILLSSTLCFGPWRLLPLAQPFPFLIGAGGVAWSLAEIAAAWRLLRLRARAAHDASEPWKCSHPTGSTSLRDDRVVMIGKSLWARLVYSALLLLFASIVRTLPNGKHWLATLAIGIGAAVLALQIATLLWEMLGRLAFGAVELQLERLPWLLGDPMRVQLVGGAKLADCELTLTLVCVRERWVQRYVSHRRRWYLEHDALYRQTHALHTDDRGYASATLELPVGALPTDMAAEEPRYWEIELHAERPGLDYHGLFLTPIYER
jgi:hypothetical protein